MMVNINLMNKYSFECVTLLEHEARALALPKPKNLGCVTRLFLGLGLGTKTMIIYMCKHVYLQNYSDEY